MGARWLEWEGYSDEAASIMKSGCCESQLDKNNPNTYITDSEGQWRAGIKTYPYYKDLSLWDKLRPTLAGMQARKIVKETVWECAPSLQWWQEHHKPNTRGQGRFGSRVVSQRLSCSYTNHTYLTRPDCPHPPIYVTCLTH